MSDYTGRTVSAHLNSAPIDSARGAATGRTEGVTTAGSTIPSPVVEPAANLPTARSLDTPHTGLGPVALALAVLARRHAQHCQIGERFYAEAAAEIARAAQRVEAAEISEANSWRLAEQWRQEAQAERELADALLAERDGAHWQQIAAHRGRVRRHQLDQQRALPPGTPPTDPH